MDFTQPHHRVVTRDDGAVWDSFESRAGAVTAWWDAVHYHPGQLVDVRAYVDPATGDGIITAMMDDSGRKTEIDLDHCRCGGAECSE